MPLALLTVLVTAQVEHLMLLTPREGKYQKCRPPTPTYTPLQVPSEQKIAEDAKGRMTGIGQRPSVKKGEGEM